MNENQITTEKGTFEIQEPLVTIQKAKNLESTKPVITGTLKNKSGKAVEFAVCYGYLTIHDGKPRNILYHNILGASALDPKEETKVDQKEANKLRLHLAVKTEKKGLFGKKTVERVYTDEEYFCESREEAWKWRNIILNCANDPDYDMSILETNDNVKVFKRNLLVFINPFGGAGKAPKNWAIAKKYLDKAGCTCIEIRTEHFKHCEEYLYKADISEILKYDGILTVSGDGLPHEVINGLKKRSDFEKLKHIPLGAIPGGSGNAIVKNVGDKAREVNTVEGSCYMVSKGQKLPIDLCRLETAKGETIYSFLSVNWAVVADIDLESEKLRCLGGFRFDVYGALRVLSLRKYRIKFAYTFEHINEKSMPKMSEEIVDSQWNKLEDVFTFFLLSSMPYISSEDVPCPISKIDDGHIDYLGQRGSNATRGKLLNLLLNIKADLFENGRPKPSNGMEHAKIRAFRLEPIGENLNPYSIDGERYDCQKMQGFMEEKAFYVYCPQHE